MTTPSSLPALYLDTLDALLAPRRLVPILLVCIPMVLAQQHFSHTGAAVWMAIAICALFVGIAPFAWRALFPRGRTHRLWPLRILAYGLLGALPTAFGWAVPELASLGETFLTAGVNLAVSAALFWVGGWGLARDIDLEQGLRQERERSDALAVEAERAQLMALRANLDPHFLFNTLNAIAEWCREDGEVAEKAILKLSFMLRQVLSGVRDRAWPLERELQLVRDLLDLHLVRDPERFQVLWQVPEPLPALEVPPLLLLPLAENAVKHGPAKGHRGALSLTVSQVGQHIHLEVGNPGPFLGPREGGLGLSTLERRLVLAYAPGTARFHIAEAQGRTVACLELPLAGPLPEGP